MKLIDCKYCFVNGNVKAIKTKSVSSEIKWVVRCLKCGIRTDFHPTEKEATTQWNNQTRSQR